MALFNTVFSCDTGPEGGLWFTVVPALVREVTELGNFLFFSTVRAQRLYAWDDF